jgi:hypothetical protein
MKRGLTAVVLGAVLLAGACGGDDDDDAGAATAEATAQTAGDDAGQPAATDTASAADEGDGADAGGDAAPADCSALTSDELAKYLVYTQVLAQVTDQDQVQTLRDQSFTDYTPEAFAAILVKLHAVLDGHSSDVFGNPEESLDFYDQANDIVGRMIASPDPVPQALFDEYTTLVGGDPTAMISKQLPINATIDELCPNL